MAVAFEQWVKLTIEITKLQNELASRSDRIAYLERRLDQNTREPRRIHQS